MINILSICNSSSAVHTIYIVKVIVTIITVAAPILLILSCMIDGIRTMISKDVQVGELLKNWSKRLIIAFVLFFIPNAVFFIGNLVSSSSEIRRCYMTATLSKAKSMKASEDARKKAEVDAWEQEQAKIRRAAEEQREKERREQEERDKQDRESSSGGSSGSSGSDEYATGREKNNNAIYTLSLKTINVTGYAVPVSSDIGGNQVLKTMRFNSKVADEADAILRNVANYVKRSPYVNYLQTAGAYVNKRGYHGMGLAIDVLNRYTYKYTYENGRTVTFTPYGKQGSDEWTSRYRKFICTVCKGVESCPQNVNYHIYYNYFKPKGWCWGGNWPSSIFDPMHFEKTNGYCSTAAKDRITPEKCGITTQTNDSSTTNTKKSSSSSVVKPGTNSNNTNTNKNIDKEK